MLLKVLTVSQCKIDKNEFSSQMPTFKVEPFGPKSVTAHAQKITTTALSVSNQSLRLSVPFCMMCNPEGFPVKLFVYRSFNCCDLFKACGTFLNSCAFIDCFLIRLFYCMKIYHYSVLPEWRGRWRRNCFSLGRHERLQWNCKYREIWPISAH